MTGSSPKSPNSPPPQGAPAPDSGALVADVDEFDDNDSAAGFSDAASSTASLTSSILQYRVENGRTYHAYKEGTYVLPNDDSENDRLELQHHLFTLTLEGRLFICPAGKETQLQRVLDVGTGTGSWAMDFADEHPEAHVIGVDLSPIQPAFVPPNVSFFVDDVTERWTYTNKFDLIFVRMLTGSIPDWPAFFKQSFEFLNPGGWVELQDITFPITSDDGTLKPESALAKWSAHMKQAADTLGRSLESAKFYKAQMEAAGFVNVTEVVYKWPMNTWAKDKRYKELGMWTRENIVGGVSGLSLALFTRGLGWSPTELEVFLVDVRKDMRDPSIHSYWPIYFVYGQKPKDAAKA